jgi:hypothetical protein
MKVVCNLATLTSWIFIHFGHVLSQHATADHFVLAIPNKDSLQSFNADLQLLQNWRKIIGEKHNNAQCLQKVSVPIFLTITDY